MRIIHFTYLALLFLALALLFSCKKEQSYVPSTINYQFLGNDGFVELFYDSSHCGHENKSIGFDTDSNHFNDVVVNLHKSCRPCYTPGPEILYLEITIGGISTCIPDFPPPMAICQAALGDSVKTVSSGRGGGIYNATRCSTWDYGSPGEKYYKTNITRTDGNLYGWIHLEVDSSIYPALRVQVIEYALNTALNQPIIVGQKE